MSGKESEKNEKILVGDVTKKIAVLEEKLEKTLSALNHIADHSRRIEKIVQETRQLVGPFGLIYPDGTALVQTLHGIKYFIDAQDMIMAPQLIVYRQWEKDLSDFFLSAVTPDTVFVDVGANIGYFTCLLGTFIGRSGTGRVFAIEPNPRVYALLERNARINWSMAPLQTFACAAGDVEATVELSVPRYGAANATLARNIGNEDVDQVLVPQHVLDALLADAPRVDLMKIDVEGFELLVLKGAEHLIRRSPKIKIVIEWSLAQMHAAQLSPQDLIGYCDKMNLAFHEVPPRYNNQPDFDWTPFEVSPKKMLEKPYGNFVLSASTR